MYVTHEDSMIFNENASQMDIAEFIARCFNQRNPDECYAERIQQDAIELWHLTEKEFTPLNVWRYA